MRKIQCTIDLSNPVPELCEVITEVINQHPDKQEEILRALSKKIDFTILRISLEKSEA